jgi:two-component system, sensor histidine kinase and response regulator
MSPEFISDAVSGSGSVAVAHPERTLLVVDDDPSVRHALWITFRELYRVEMAESGGKALELFGRRPADVALLDIRMPGMSGLELLQKLKQTEPGIEVILLTAYESVEYVREAMRLGACDFITKPFEVDGLRAAVNNAMERRETTRKAAAYNRKLIQLQNEVQHQQIREELARTRNEIYASIIHDINGPLTVVAGYVELIQQVVRHAHVLEGEPLDLLRSHTESIARQVTHCIELSRRYLSFLEGKTAPASGTMVKEVFFDVAELLRTHPQVRSNDLIVHPFEQEIAVAINGTDLLQVLINLTVNALQCSAEPHRVELYGRIISSSAPRPFLQPGSNSRLIRAKDFPQNTPLAAISVQDNGPGIPETLLDRVFEPYFTTKEPGHGSGLGLSIVRRLVLQAHGAVHIYSHFGEGTVFTVYLPLHQPPPKISAS